MTVKQFQLSDMLISEHQVSVPLDWRDPQHSPCINVFYREVVSVERAAQKLPLLLFLQGGPGGKSPRPQSGHPCWLPQALETYRVILLDQRGTGQSSRIDASLIAHKTAEQGRDYLLNFRADSIIKDCEYIRKTCYHSQQFYTLGQSYGGFLTLSYLSYAPQALAGCFVTGGLAGIDATAEQVYQLTYPLVAEKTELFYQQYPDTRVRLAQIGECLANEAVYLPDGERLTAERFQSLGILLGTGSGMQTLYYLVDEAFAGHAKQALSDTFLAQVMMLANYWDNPLYAVMQESIYGQGQQATNWAAQRVRDQLGGFKGNPESLPLTGEMIYPWMFEQIGYLKPFAPAANALAAYNDYSYLYDLECLGRNEVLVVAAVYANDMYVPRTLSERTAQLTANLHTWVTDKFEHDGVRQSTEVFEHLTTMMHELSH
ncbi:alpha/beta fold hydrolase [Celerinatantimonas diazotrophica]|uniref:Proline iminopeptidase n=1 Tax=Celerinatantimonas diazotrophica TaxID=412034 RepID=A0A4R1JM13_9GAMM|nr:alpha/beta fold hydrolase [Celerinatantimonas diazotrophica]TCK52086.1 proline iminopeptidase [Celerinatantimonas diazotrophica]CAG9296209.1 Proline iminopeptidase [Celerinatantimonas diazotrophica]